MKIQWKSASRARCSAVREFIKRGNRQLRAFNFSSVENEAYREEGKGGNFIFSVYFCAR